MFGSITVSPRSQGSKSNGGTASGGDTKGGDETMKRRRISPGKHVAESSTSGDETLSAFPCLVTLNQGVRIATVAAGGRHTLALSGKLLSRYFIAKWYSGHLTTESCYLVYYSEVSDVGQVWGWGYGGEGQLGLGSRIRMVSSPHPIPCIDSSFSKDLSMALSRGSMGSEGQGFRVPGSCVIAIACGGRHSAVITGRGLSHFLSYTTCFEFYNVMTELNDFFSFVLAIVNTINFCDIFL